MPTYIYAITRADHPMRIDDLLGVGDPPGQLRTVRTQELGAVVSEAPDALRAKRRDLVAHQSVLERLLADGAALPMRFGLVGADDQQVSDALEENAEDYTARLRELDGCLEYNLKLGREEEDLLREIVTDSEEVARLRELTRQEPNVQEHKMALGELVSQEVQARQDAEAREIAARLASSAERYSFAEPTAESFLNVSFLVKRGDAAAFSETVDDEIKGYGEAYTMKLNGPLPPYSFV